MIAFNKQSGIPIQPDKTESLSLLSLAEIYCKHPVYLIHRIDRPASGVAVFAKTKKAIAHLNTLLQERKIEKTYFAVVKNIPENREGELEHFLEKNAKTNKSYVAKKESKKARLAKLSYKVVDSIDNYHLLEIKLMTGRHHQIRVQLASIGSPIKGDVKYGARRSNKDRSIHLHARKMVFSHPVSKKRISLLAPLPTDTIWQAFEYPKSQKNE